MSQSILAKEQRITKEQLPELVAELLQQEPTFLLSSSHAESASLNIDASLNLLVLLLKLNDKAVDQITRYTSVIAANAEGQKKEQIEAFLTIPVQLVIEILDSAYSYLEGQEQQQDDEVITYTYFLLAYLFHSSAQQLRNELTPIATKQKIVSQYLAMDDENQSKKKGLEKHLPELIDRLDRVRLTVAAMAELKNSNAVVLWLNHELAIPNRAIQARNTMQDLYHDFLTQIQVASETLPPSSPK